MGYIKNYSTLATSDNRKIVLDLIEVALDSIQPEKVLEKNFAVSPDTIKIQGQTINIDDFKRIFLLGFGKGSAKISQLLETSIGNFLTKGYCIDVTPASFSKIEFTLGTHPLPSQANFDFTQKVLDNLNNLSERDLIIIVTCGGGSALLEKPNLLTLDLMVAVNKALLQSGANISEMNIIRKHLSSVKGGGLAKAFFPATIFNLIFSDVPGNDLTVIASAPTVKDPTTVEDVKNVCEKYSLKDKLNLPTNIFVETPKEDKYFEKVTNFLILSNLTALLAMKQKAQQLGLQVIIYSDKFQGEAKFVGKELIEKTPPHSILLVGGETTVKVTGVGEGGRNQELILGALPYLHQETVIVSLDSDGWDNSPAAGALADQKTRQKVQELHLDPRKFQEQNSSFIFFKSVGDAIITDRLSSNISDLMIVFKK